MRAGELNRRIVIQQKSITRLASGAESSSWLTLANSWAKVVQQKQDEEIENDSHLLTDQLTFKIRYRSDLDNEMRILYEGSYYEILSIKELGFRKGLSLTALGLDVHEAEAAIGEFSTEFSSEFN